MHRLRTVIAAVRHAACYLLAQYQARKAAARARATHVQFERMVRKQGVAWLVDDENWCTAPQASDAIERTSVSVSD